VLSGFIILKQSLASAVHPDKPVIAVEDLATVVNVPGVDRLATD
jgi:hypothetical protein